MVDDTLNGTVDVGIDGAEVIHPPMMTVDIHDALAATHLTLQIVRMIDIVKSIVVKIREEGVILPVASKTITDDQSVVEAKVEVSLPIRVTQAEEIELLQGVIIIEEMKEIGVDIVNRDLLRIDAEELEKSEKVSRGRNRDHILDPLQKDRKKV